MKSVIRIGTRGSQLALYQAELVGAKLNRDFSMVKVEIVRIKTRGDMIRRGGLAPFETKRVFTREIEEALLKGEVDLAVHSAKDMSVHLPEGTQIGAVLEREDPRDCLISKDSKKLSELPLGARIGTSSIRRRQQLLRWNPKLIIEDIRGNVETRIRKIDEGECDAVVLAYAGIRRLDLTNFVADIFPEEHFYPSPGQGAIAVQIRSEDEETAEFMKTLHHSPSATRLACERAFLRKLEGGCNLPCGISTRLEGEKIKAVGALFSHEGLKWSEGEYEGATATPEDVGHILAKQILDDGGQEILDAIRKSL